MREDAERDQHHLRNRSEDVRCDILVIIASSYLAAFGHNRSLVVPEPRNFYAADFNAILGMLPDPSFPQRATGLLVAGSSVQVRTRVGRCLRAPLLDSLTKLPALTWSTVSCSFNSCLPPRCVAADIPPCAGTD